MVRRSHREGALPCFTDRGVVGRLYTDLDRFEGEEPVPLELPAGSAIWFHADVVHGSRDSLVRPEGSQRFVGALESVSTAPVAYAEIPGGTHGLDYFNSIRSKAIVEGIGSFLDAVRARRTAPRADHP